MKHHFTPPLWVVMVTAKFMAGQIISLFLLTAVSFWICGCASVGNNFEISQNDFDDGKISQIKKGETTEPELIQMLGQPRSRSVNAEGISTLTWTYAESLVKGVSFIPYAGAFMGGTNSKRKTLTVSFLNGKVTSFSSSGGGMETPQEARVVSKNKDDTIEIIVLPSMNKDSKIAVRHLRNRDWQKALNFFGQAVNENPEDHLSIFGMGVCWEKLGDDYIQSGKSSSKDASDKLDPSLSCYKSALEQYKAAVLLYIDSKYEASRDRAEMKINDLTQDNPDHSSAPPH